MNTRKIAALLLALAMVFALAACGSAGGEPSAQPTESAAAATGSPAPAAESSESPAPAAESSESPEPSVDDGVWADAQYTEDTELGEGAKTITFECTADDKTVAFTIHTDAEYLRAALEDNGLIAGDESEFGMYVKSVNGMSADYEADGYYWSLYVDGDYATSGVDTTPVTDGMSCAFVREAA